MNRFVNCIVSSNGGRCGGNRNGIGGGILSRDEFHRQLSKQKLIWFGEFHSEQRILAFFNDTILSLLDSMEQRHRKRTNKNQQHHLQRPPAPKLHVIMEHFSIEMQDLLEKFQTDPDCGFSELKQEYQEIGTEGHGLDPYRGFLMYGKNRNSTLETKSSNGGTERIQSQVPDMVLSDHNDRRDTSSRNGDCRNNSASNLLFYGGFVPRPYASRWNKAETIDQKQDVLEELYEKDLLPPPTSPMHDGLWSDRESLLFRGNPSHFRLIQSMMSGEDLYDDQESNFDEDKTPEIGTATPIQRLYQAQLLKDHAAAYKLSKILMQDSNGEDDKFVVLAGIGHLKHRLGIPHCLDLYLRAQSLHGSDIQSRAKALDTLVTVSKFSSLVGPQMLYETEIEDRHKPLEDAIELDDENDDPEYVTNKQTALNDLFRKQPELFDELVLGSEIIQQRMTKYDEGRGNFEHPSCDFCYVYDEDDDNLLDDSSLVGEMDKDLLQSSCPRTEASAAKGETLDAYNSVGESAFRKGNLVKAKTIMKQLGYTEEDMGIIGDDCLYNFQGVANPHKEANLQPGEDVLDVGSGLGVDSFLAAARVGAAPSPLFNTEKAGTVTGVDLAPKQVAHSNAVAKAKKVDDRVVFFHGDAERLSKALQDTSNKFDVCISNGAFCLIPDKGRAFREIFGALKPGGRMAVSTTTIQDSQDGNNNDTKNDWPLCMKMFANLSELKPMCEAIGFENVRIVDAESPMEMEFSEEVYEAAFGDGNDNPDRFKIHGKEKYADQYKYLEEMNMDELCKIVTVCATKPMTE